MGFIGMYRGVVDETTYLCILALNHNSDVFNPFLFFPDLYSEGTQRFKEREKRISLYFSLAV